MPLEPLELITKISIDGNDVPVYQQMTLYQSIDAHHILNLVCRKDVLDKAGDSIAKGNKNYLGKSIIITVSKEKTDLLEFKGVVTSIHNTKGSYYQQGDLINITAHSCSIIADDGPNYASFYDKNLKDILTDTFKPYESLSIKLDQKFDPANTDALHYSVQHHQSAFDYASRLAAQFSEWFYYDGKALVFGKLEDKNETTLSYGEDLQEFSIELNPAPNSFKYFTNDYLKEEQQDHTSEKVNSSMNGFNADAIDAGKSIYPNETKVLVSTFNDPKLKNRLDKHVEQQKKAEELRQVVVNGSSNNPEVQLGQIVTIETEKETEDDKSEKEKEVVGKFRITRVTHSAGENGHYQNHFVGISADSDVYPNTNIMAFPRSETQVAKVVENADPDGIGRVRVKFQWQEGEEMSPWIRLLTPHAGGEKGFHFIPEKDEEVLIGFEGGNAERPYVMGALYTGKTKVEGWKSEKNDIKAIKTKGGHTILFNDEEKKETLTISDKNGNSITLDTAKSAISISAPKTLTLSAKEINISGTDKVNINGKEITVDGSDKVNVNSKEIAADGSSKVAITSSTKVEVSAASTSVSGDTELKLESATVDINGSIMTNVKGAMVNLNS